MPLQGQFSLSLELTRLIPLSLAAIGKTYEAAMSLARDLQSSGSDIVVEEDLAEVFGRCRINDNIASSFRAAMSMPDPPETLHNGLTLFRGPGPTVARALTEPPYFSTIVQCSFLVSVHEKASLAAVISNYFERIAEEAPSNNIRRATPSLESIRGMLQACEDQTATYLWHWRMQLLAVATMLGVDEFEINETMPPVVLRGLMAMLPLTQYFPEDRYILVETPRGTCSIIVWAHLLLGLRVLVRLYSDKKCTEIRFPPNQQLSEQILVDVRTHINWSDDDQEPIVRDPSVILLSTSTREQLFRLKADPDDDIVDATFKRPVKGLGRRILSKETLQRDGRERVVEELSYIACSFAICIAKDLVMLPATGQAEFDTVDPDEEEMDSNGDDQVLDILPYPTTPRRIFEASCMLFDVSDRKFSSKMAEQYASMYTGRGFYDIQEPPGSISAILSEWKDEYVWPHLRLIAIYLSVIILAFAHVVDIESCQEMPVCELLNVVGRSALCMEVSGWDGKRPLPIKEDVWLEIIALMMVGQAGSGLDLQTTCLISDCGWSLYINTFGDSDPSYIDPGHIVLKRGIPWRNGVWKHRVVDGPVYTRDHQFWKMEGGCGDTATLKCAVPVEFIKPMIGERGDGLVVTLRLRAMGLRDNDGSISDQIRRTGYNELWTSLWRVQKTRSCQHPARLGEKLTLEPGWSTVSGFGDHGTLEELDRLTICLTAGNPAARWRALLSILQLHDVDGHRVMLRVADCCFSCAAQQAAAQEGRGSCYLVL